MFFKNARIFCSDLQFHNGAFSVADGKFDSLLPDRVPREAIDLQGATVIPGLVDVHIHGCMGADLCDCSPEGLKTMAAYLAGQGITAFVPASMTVPYETLEAAFAAARQLQRLDPPGCARLLGVRMEGPFLSDRKKGAQNGAHLQMPDISAFQKLYDACDGLISMVDIAPELPGGVEFIEKASRLCAVSIAHTNADYARARDGFAAGATHLTHLFNAMPPIHHRAPGVIEAAAEHPNVSAELICDGLHVHPAAVRLAFAMFGKERMVLISDALRCLGLPDGAYELGGQQVFLSGGVARLSDGTLAGSATGLYDCMVNAIRFGIPEADAVRAATYQPACAVGAQKEAGLIAPGRRADFIICRPDYSGKRVFLGGKEISVC